MPKEVGERHRVALSGEMKEAWGHEMPGGVGAQDDDGSLHIPDQPYLPALASMTDEGVRADEGGVEGERNEPATQRPAGNEELADALCPPPRGPAMFGEHHQVGRHEDKTKPVCFQPFHDSSPPKVRLFLSTDPCARGGEVPTRIAESSLFLPAGVRCDGKIAQDDLR